MKTTFLFFVFVLVFIFCSHGLVLAYPYDEYGTLIQEGTCNFKDTEVVPKQILIGLSQKVFCLPENTEEALINDCIISDKIKETFSVFGAVSIRKIFSGFYLDDFKSNQNVPDLSRFFTVNFKDNIDIALLCQMLGDIPGVLFVQPNRLLQNPEYDNEFYANFTNKSFPLDDPNDLDWAKQWNLKNTTRGIGCPNAWAITTGDSTVRIGVLEDGISSQHYDLDIFGGRSFKLINGSPAAAALDTSLSNTRDHPTQVAGIISAKTNNLRGIAGIAGGNNGTSGCRLISLQIIDWTEEVLAYALYKAPSPTYLDCDIVNMSFAYDCYSEPVRAAISFCNSQGVNIVAAKGQAVAPDSSFYFPADLDYSWVTSVGCFGKDGLFCDNGDSCYTYSHFGWGVDILGPGESYPSLIKPGNGAQDFNDSDLNWFLGTSGASPHVAASLGLLRSVLGNGLKPIDYESILKLNSRDEYGYSNDGNPQTWNSRYGHGCLEIGSTLEFATNTDNEIVHFSTNGSLGTPLCSIKRGYTFMSGPFEGFYSVIPYLVTGTISFGGRFSSIPIVWGEGGLPYLRTSSGFSAASPNYCIPFNSVSNTSVSISGCNVFTYVFKVYDPINPNIFLGWYPSDPTNTPIGCVAYGTTSKSFTKLKNKPLTVEVGPNPFNTTLIISFDLPVETQVTIEVFDIRGLKVRDLSRRVFSSGNHTQAWDGRDNDGRDLPSGSYLVSTKILGNQKTQKVVMVK